MNFEIFCVHITVYLNTMGSIQICMFFVMASGKCELHTYFTSLQRILTSTHMKNLIFFCIIYVAMSTFTFQVSIMSKWLAKHISTKVSFKITIRKRDVYIDIRWHRKWKQEFYLGIRKYERSITIFLPFFNSLYD